MINQDFNEKIDEILSHLKKQNIIENLDSGQVVNLVTLKCPEPLMMLRQSFRTASRGDLFIIFSTDPSTERDFVSYCRFSGHRMEHKQSYELGMSEYTLLYVYIIQKMS